MGDLSWEWSQESVSIVLLLWTSLVFVNSENSLVSEIEKWDLWNLVVCRLALWHDIAWGWEEVLLRSSNGVDLDRVAILKRINGCWFVINEWSVLSRGLWVSPVLVLMVYASMDDFIIDHSGKVLETVELDGLVVGVQDDWVGALTASAG